MASYSFEPSSPPMAASGADQQHGGALHPSASFTAGADPPGGAILRQDDLFQGRRAPVTSGSMFPYQGATPREYRTLAEAARVLAHAADQSLPISSATASGTASPASSLLQQQQAAATAAGGLSHQPSNMLQMPPCPPLPPPAGAASVAPPHYRRPPDWRLHGVGPNALPVLVSDDVVSGTKRNGWMSPVRRFFCLLLTFDVLFTGLLWIITVIVTGRDVKAAVRQQVLEYTIHDSMFDCVMAGAGRFLVNILFYAALDVNHWSPVAFTTTGTSVFTVAKVFEYQWTRFGNLTFDVMLLLLTFVLSWGELWFLDVRVLPLELRASELVSQLEDTERAPLLGSNANGHYGGAHGGGGAADLLRRCVEGGSVWGESVANFYSPLESPEDSGDEIEEGTLVHIPKRFKRKTPLNQKEGEYSRMGVECLETAWTLLNSPGWKVEKKVEATGDVVFTKTVKGKKIFKIHGTVDVPPKLLMEELFFQVDRMPQWNPQVQECKTIQSIDSHTDISYQVSAEAAGGAISTRDFVSLRHWGTKTEDGETVYISAGVSVKHPAMPPQPKKVRGENGPNCWAMRAVPGSPDSSSFRWVLDTDIKGWIPQYVIDQALSGAQFEYMGHLRKLAEEMRRSGRVADFHAREEGAAYASLNNTGAAAASLQNC